MTAISLPGCSVAITGAARGIGYATAKAFLAAGARVFIGDLDADLAKAAAADLGCVGTGLDVRSRESFAAFLAGVDPPVRVLVNNAGIMPAGRFVEESDAVTDAIIDVNLNGVLRGTKLALPGMLERGSGHIVNVASYLGVVPAAGLATYCASKHAVVGFSESLRDEVAGTGVTVTAVLPSAVRTDLVSGVKLGGLLPTVDPEVIAEAVVESCRTRPAIVAVPGWMRSYEAAAAVVPDRLLGAIRGRLTRDRVLRKLDSEARASYDERIRREAGADSS
ncbi:MAG: SDR family oxidoreductase [Mycobacteriaceae bacterium]|nr:SDR family oxidoreductase [Mycobacterium sp.]NBP84131.1 SDR family oxidoreductase [Mycobacteriaceae bacterium]NBQ41237.1 SDR family oxidoreductase [Mycobacteriaceae bacterium]